MLNVGIHFEYGDNAWFSFHFPQTIEITAIVIRVSFILRFQLFFCIWFGFENKYTLLFTLLL